LPSSGTVQAVGAFDASASANKMRLDNFTVEAMAPYVAWIDSYSLSGLDAEMDADPDFDEMDNLVEYALGGNPTNGDASEILPVSGLASAGGTNWMEYIYHRRIDAPARGLTYEMMRNDELVSGLWTSSGIISGGTAVLDAEFEAVTNRIPTEIELQQFLRLKIGIVENPSGNPVDIPIDSEALMKGYVLPPVIFNPGEEYGSEARNYQGIPGIERAPGGRLWATWYAGPVWEDRFNYMLVATSGDDGATWTDTSFVIDPDGDGPKRVADPCFWLDPNGKLWLFWWLNGDGLSVTMAMTTENPDVEEPVWTKPFPLFSGVMLNKPIITSTGEWLMPSAIWHRDDSCRVVVSKDSGKTWALRGAANVPPERRNCDEEMIVERKDGSFWMLVRTADYGIGDSVSTDGGRTWTEVKDCQKHATTRFTLRKLKSGNLLLIRNGSLDQRTGRDHMTAYLSEDDGVSWKGGLLLDERQTSYPDATQSPDGAIYAIYDQDRGGEKGIVMAVFTEADILAGIFSSPQARGKIRINQATGDNPLKGRIGEGPDPRTDTNAVPLVTGALRAGQEPVKGEIRGVPMAADYIFSDRDYISRVGIVLRDRIPSARQFVFSSMDQTEVVCSSPGMVYVLTPASDRNPAASAEAELLLLGFEKTAVQEIDVLLKTDEKARRENLCSIYQKRVEAGERIKFGRWGVLVF